MRYFVEIGKVGNSYSGRIHQGSFGTAQDLTGLALGENHPLTINGKAYELGELVKRFIDYEPEDMQKIFNESGLVTIGEHLFAQVFGKVKISPSQYKPIEVRIVTSDVHVARLPWVLLANQGIFVSENGWSVAQSIKVDYEDCELPPSPRVLIVAPEPIDPDLPQTDAQQHIEELEVLLSRANSLHTLERNLRVAYEWDEFTNLVETFKPHVVYYYGHGEGDFNNSSLIFATGLKSRKFLKPVKDVANCLRNASRDLRLVYINCCKGDSGGLLGAGWQLGDFAPAVITNTTYSQAGAARAQAGALLNSLLIMGTPPHIAVTQMRSNLVNWNLSFGDVRWMTPVLHCHYKEWKSNPPTPVTRLDRDPHWRYKLDRFKQFSDIAQRTRTMLKTQKPRSLAYLWYGKQGQGVELFQNRIKIELQEDLTDKLIYEVSPRWPNEFYIPHRSFTDMLTEAFNARSLDEIPGIIRSESRSISGRQTLVYVRHEPITPNLAIDPSLISTYLRWWDSNFVPLITGQVFGLLGISFIVKKPDRFKAAFIDGEKINAIKFRNLAFYLLDEMGGLELSDLLDFIRFHDIPLPEGQEETILNGILQDCDHQYEKVLEALKDIQERAWVKTDTSTYTPDQSRQDYDYN
ncbi:MAG TPA: hypothetical protein VJX74_01490 [Blastocatellia bacterium]|nr:hypothetical protein [Blastocatellia bacterium]